MPMASKVSRTGKCSCKVVTLPWGEQVRAKKTEIKKLAALFKKTDRASGIKMHKLLEKIRSRYLNETPHRAVMRKQFSGRLNK